MAADSCVTRHVIEVYDRGGTNLIDRIVNVSRVGWGRVRDDISDASLFITGANCADQETFLRSLRASRHELVIWRDDEREWEGPITRLHGTRNGFEIFAADVLHYTRRTTMRSAYDNRASNVTYVTTRARQIIQNELARKEALDPPINVLPYLVEHHLPTDARTAAFTPPYKYQVFEHIDQLAAKSGMDYTAVGRAIHLWDTHEPLGVFQEVATQADFLGDLSVTEYGMELATHSHVTDGEGNYGSAGDNDPYYGEVEILATAYDEEDEGPAPTNAAMESQAARNLSGRLPTPLQVRVPDNSTIDPNGVLKVPLLVPGVWIPVRADVIGFSVQQMQKLSTMRVEETGAGETVAVSLYPASIADEEAPE